MTSGGGRVELESVVVGPSPILNADVNEVVFFSDGEPNHHLQNDGDVDDDGNEQDQIDEAADEITAIETDGVGPDQAFNIDAFGANVTGNLTATIDGADADNDANAGAGDDDVVILSDGGVDIASVSAWSNAVIDVANLVDANDSGDGVGSDGSPDAELNGTEVLRFDFGPGTDYDGVGDYTTLGFNGPAITSATFTLDDNNGGGDTTFAWTVHFVGGGSEAGSQVVTNDEGVTITATLPANIGKTIDYIEFNVTSGQGRVDLQSVVLAEPPAMQILDQIDTGGDADNITTNDGLGDVLAPLLQSIAGSDAVLGDPVPFDISALVDFGTDGANSGGGLHSDDFPRAALGGGIVSNGLPVWIVSDGTTLTGFVNDGVGGNEFNDGSDTEVFTLVLNPDGTGTFTLIEGVSDGGVDETVHLEFGQFVTATDRDFDRITLLQDDICFIVPKTEPAAGDADAQR